MEQYWMLPNKAAIIKEVQKIYPAYQHDLREAFVLGLEWVLSSSCVLLSSSDGLLFSSQSICRKDGWNISHHSIHVGKCAVWWGPHRLASNDHRANHCNWMWTFSGICRSVSVSTIPSLVLHSSLFFRVKTILLQNLQKILAQLKPLKKVDFHTIGKAGSISRMFAIVLSHIRIFQEKIPDFTWAKRAELAFEG